MNELRYSIKWDGFEHIVLVLPVSKNIRDYLSRFNVQQSISHCRDVLVSNELMFGAENLPHQALAPLVELIVSDILDIDINVPVHIQRLMEQL